MNLFQLAEHIRSNEAAIEFLRQRGILRALDHPPLCPVCGQEMAVARRESTADGVTWRCQRRINGRKHSRKISIRKGLIFHYRSITISIHPTNSGPLI